MDKFVYIKPVDIYDEKVFTVERAKEWENHLLDCYEDVFHGLKDKIRTDFPVQFAVNQSLLREVIIDAIIGMRKIVDSKYNSIEDPNSFKIAAYLSYWWLRHKPTSVHFSKKHPIEDIELSFECDDSIKEKEKQKLIWQLKHVNELVAVHMVCTYIFDFDVVLCDDRRCDIIKSKEQERFCFENFEEMKEILLRKITYYFAYRALTPKTIEHMLEGYTFHPAWGLTGAQWSLDGQEMAP